MAFLFLILILGTHAPYTEVQHLQALLIWLCVHSFGLWLCFFSFSPSCNNGIIVVVSVVVFLSITVHSYQAQTNQLALANVEPF